MELNMPTVLASYNKHLLMAYYGWYLENNLRPHLTVDSTQITDPVLLRQASSEGTIIFNVNPTAVAGFSVTNDQVSFNCRFSGKDHYVCVPLSSIIMVYTPDQNGFLHPIILPQLPRVDAVAAIAAEAAKQVEVKGDNIVSLNRYRQK